MPKVAELVGTSGAGWGGAVQLVMGIEWRNRKEPWDRIPGSSWEPMRLLPYLTALQRPPFALGSVGPHPFPWLTLSSPAEKPVFRAR